MPDNDFRVSTFKVMADTIRFMNSHNPNCWSINFGGSGPYVNIEHEVAFWVDGRSRTVRLHVYLTYMSAEDRARLESEGTVIDKEADKWSEIQLHLPEQEQLIPSVRLAHEAYLADKAHHDIHPNSIAPHLDKGAGVIEYMRRDLSMLDLDQPGYVPVARMGVSEAEAAGETTNNVRNGRFSLQVLMDSISANGLHFTAWQVATFYTALQTKGFVILSGISGTGKTKLAQAFARLLPQPATLTVIPEDIIRIAVQPYMHKYNRLVIPKSFVELFTPPEAGQSFDVVLQFDGQKENCMLKHYQYSSTDYIQINLKGNVKNWFLENFPEGRPIALDIQADADGKLNGFRLGRPEDFAQAVATQSNGNPLTYLFLSVRPDWRDSKSLLGFYNPLEQKYQSTPFLEFIKRASESYGHQDGLAWFVVLDEMNLARVEYYFADLLSVLESGRDADGFCREPIRLDYPTGLEIPREEREIRLPPNLYFIGTVNIDETTHAFSPKVLDRAFTLELTEADFTQYPASGSASVLAMDESLRKSLLEDFSRQGRYAQIEKEEISDYVTEHPDLREKLQTLNRWLQSYDLHFGYRVFDEIAAYMANAEMNGFYMELIPQADPFDAAVLMKVLPKFHGSRSKLEEPLKIVLAWCLNPLAPDLDRIEQATKDEQSSVQNLIAKLAELPYVYPNTAGRVIRMLRALYTTGFAAFG